MNQDILDVEFSTYEHIFGGNFALIACAVILHMMAGT